MSGYICPYCCADTDGPVGLEGCERCSDLENEAYEQASSEYWEEEDFVDEWDDALSDFEDLDFEEGFYVN